MNERTIGVIREIDAMLDDEHLSSQEQQEFVALRCALVSVVDSIEFAAGETCVTLTFPNCYTSSKTINFLHEHKLELDASTIGCDVTIWFEDEDADDEDVNDEDADDEDADDDIYDDEWLSDDFRTVT